MATVKLHTAFIIIGPPKCGKTFFINNILHPQLTTQLENLKHYPLSLTTFDYSIEKNLYKTSYSNNKDETIQNVITTIINKINMYTNYPIVEPFITIETTYYGPLLGQILDTCTKNGYSQVILYFNYAKHKDYLKYFDITVNSNNDNIGISNDNIDISNDNTGISNCISNDNTCIVSNQENYSKKQINNKVFKYKKEIFTGLKDFDCLKTQIKNINKFTLKIDSKNLEWYRSLILPETNKYFIIGDVHCCVDEVKKLLLENDFTIEDDIIICNKYDLIFIGDLIDKGTKTSETINFFYKNINNPRIKYVLGNHEETILQVLNGKTDKDAAHIKKYFSSCAEIVTDSDLTNKFKKICSVMRPFYVYHGSSGSHSFYVNHSPCPFNCLFKTDTKSLQQQVHYSYKSLPKEQQNFNFFVGPGNSNSQIYQVVGHVYVPDTVFTNNGKIFIDTGCIAGNRLSGVILGYNKMYPSFKSVKFLGLQGSMENTSYIIDDIYLRKTPTNTTMIKQIEHYKYIAAHNINFMSGTITPAAASIKDQDFESLEECLNYYKKKVLHIKDPFYLVIEPKYMGSRLNVYLFNDISKCFGVTRKGHLANVDKSLFVPLHERLSKYMSDNQVQLMIIDSELMPWSTLGQNLIDNTFMPMHLGTTETSKWLNESGLDQILKDMDVTMNDNTKKIDNKTKQIYKHFMANYIDPQTLLDLGTKYLEQLTIHSKQEEPYLKPFDILKIRFEDGTEVLPGITEGIYPGPKTKSECFNFVNDDEYLLFDINDITINHLELLTTYFDKLTKGENYEGIIVRPNILIFKDICPYMKVRNKEYLRLIYGYDYMMPNKFDKLINKKSIKEKKRLCIEQFDLGYKMLTIPYDEVSKSKQMKKYYLKFYNSLLEGDQIDPRL